jgi:adenosylcobinamide-phosphate synthase
MRLEYQILIAVGLDLLFGDPRWFPHPVKYIGRLAMALEKPMRRLFRSPRAAGIVTAFLVVSITVAVVYALLVLAGRLHPVAEVVVGVFFIYSGLAARDLVRHAHQVWRALNRDDIEQARRRVAMICGRDTESLDSSDISRATVESVAENMVDGVTAPLFFAVLAGPLGIMAYKAISTLDSTFGYKSEPYAEFGWASARLDDVAAFVPSRITAVFVPLAALILKLRPFDSLRVFARDRGKHPSPNAGQSEAAVAGALGVQLGGLSYYQGRASEKPLLGDPVTAMDLNQIRRANALMLTTSFIFFVSLLCMRVVCLNVWNTGF